VLRQLSGTLSLRQVCSKGSDRSIRSVEVTADVRPRLSWEFGHVERLETSLRFGTRFACLAIFDESFGHLVYVWEPDF